MQEFVVALAAVTMTHNLAEAAVENRIAAIVLALDAGLSWTSIGAAMGMSKQTANNRFRQQVVQYRNRQRPITDAARLVDEADKREDLHEIEHEVDLPAFIADLDGRLENAGIGKQIVFTSDGARWDFEIAEGKHQLHEFHTGDRVKVRITYTPPADIDDTPT